MKKIILTEICNWYRALDAIDPIGRRRNKFSDANKPILAQIDGSYDNWKYIYSTDDTGTKPFTLSFLGNIGSQLCRVRTRNDTTGGYNNSHMQFLVKASGSNQKEIIEAYKKEIMNANTTIGLVKTAVDAAFSLLEIILGFMAIFAGWCSAGLGALILVAVQLVITAVKKWIIDGWFEGRMETNFEKQIKEEYPK